MVVIKLKLPTRELGVIVEKIALEKEEGLRDKVQDLTPASEPVERGVG